MRKFTVVVQQTIRVANNLPVAYQKIEIMTVIYALEYAH
jgi:hypothetical protein